MPRIGPRSAPVLAETAVHEAPRASGAAVAEPTRSPPVDLPRGPASPAGLRGAARAAHVRGAILELEAPIRRSRPDQFRAKMEKLTESPFIFFRGTADLFTRDLVGLDLAHPRVLSNGDLHPENLGVLRAPDGTLFYGLDDHDEAGLAPLGWDLRRAVASLELAARDRGFEGEVRAQVVDAFLSGYLDARRAAAEGEGQAGPRFVAGRGPRSIRAALEKASGRVRADFLAKYGEGGRFGGREDLAPLPAEQEAVARALVGYRQGLAIDVEKEARFFRVKDVAEKTGSGTGSIGLRRLWVRLEGKSKQDGDDVILELKERRGSVLERHAGVSPLGARGARRVEEAVDRLWSGGDRFAGQLSLGGVDYRVRERHPRHERVALAKLDGPALADYARAMGALVFDLHATPLPGSKKKPAALAKAQEKAAPADALRAELGRYAVEAADRVTRDHAAFTERVRAGELA